VTLDAPQERLQQLAAQVVCAGFDGTSAADAPLAKLAELGIRAVILFARNVPEPEGLRSLTAAVQAALADDLPAIVSIDQEGGQVARIRQGVVALPAMMALGATRDRNLARRAGRRLGHDLRALGINLDFAPVLDLAVDERNTVIGSRSFGSEPELVADLGLAFAAGLRDGGVIAVGKHFPGHGSTDVDSHLALPRLSLDEATWRARDLVPFAHAVRGGIPAIMTAHVVLTALDAARPTTLSPKIVRGILREELQFDGVVFSDCLEMAALGGDPARNAPLALAAGVDCVVVSHHLELAASAIDAIVHAVENGALPRERLDEAAARMQRLRASIDGANADAGVEDAEIGLKIAHAAVRVLRGSIALSAGTPVTVVSFEDGEQSSLSGALRRRGHKSEIMRVGLDPTSDEIEVLEMVLRGLSQRPIVILTRRAQLHPEQAAAVLRILAIAPNAIVISAREPYDAALFDHAENLACIYDDTEISLEGLADAMAGRSAAVR
jgi:beta-N-acetylhexosaminidase